MPSKNYLRFIFLLFSLSTLFACGGGDSPDDSEKSTEQLQPTTKSYSITVIDGYLKFASAWLDLNNDGKQDADEPTTTTQENGKGIFTLSSDIDPKKYSVLVFAEAGKTFDESLNGFVENDYILASPEGEQVITPITTLVYLKSRNQEDKKSSASQLRLQLNLSSQNLHEDFIASGNIEQTTLAADLVRLSLMPESRSDIPNLIKDPQVILDDLTEYMTIRKQGNNQRVVRDTAGNFASDTDKDDIADPDDTDIDGDNTLNTQDKFPYDSMEWVDLDDDNVGDNSDNDIDGDGILNDEDENPLLAEFYTAQNPGDLTIPGTISDDIFQNKWQYFVVNSPAEIMLNISLEYLSGDVDLYVQQNKIPTKFDYQCRSNLSNTQAEKCIERVTEGGVYYIALFAREDSNFKLSVITEEVKKNKAMLLLHGLASDPGTWKDMIDDDSFFNGKCQILTVDNIPLSTVETNQDGISCFNLEFGSFDRGSNFSAAGLDNKRCIPISGCNGDYTTFEGLGYEVKGAIKRIVEHLGQDTEIFIFGHSRGGLAARAYLQNQQDVNKSLVKGFATTGTPHQGSPLGRFYAYMAENCVPKNTYRQDGSKCEDNWEMVEMLYGTRTFFLYNYSKDYQMDLQAPGIDFLSPDSSSIKNLNENLSGMMNLTTGALVYEGTEFGLLGEDVKFLFDYDLYDYHSGVGDHPHPDTLTYIENGQTRASFIGDGIVPVYSQKLSLLLENKGLVVTKEGVNKTSNILHTEETSQVTDIDWLFEGLYPTLGWGLKE
ncbi:peptidase domain protein [Psychromonas ingrahamii 37]|uniref:Peptidase domain protein n=1 Tax=Psychromonas ingrahamii (strain DSM 17664 / CCUG 51855 / 37) TaxID=357804 RepID=A1SS06_PSYIN|nr:pre-peptidase C-terminal domain-containing protein [Psychromonas ingrahamii]ABM02271.1 peptidase domain protein [Psychromonas ingrahamii 37]